MPERNLLLEAMKAGQHVIFDPHGSQTEPFTAEVEMLLGGIPVVVFSDGSEQFLDDSAEPCLAYSPRLMSGELEAFCRANISRYETFNALHGETKLKTERVPIEPFW
ncbi:hypothetical protein N0754_19280 [Pseudomonas aeruginosa]|nr:hypothetical protein [Pseudomonas aeruginosa]MCS9764379.1 hypothetical protein [Pseudomonas aeruginosa]MCS9822419.1 hypothetical protein [Pseudomonas aeruginosa]MCT0241136.1 hypothetical protein [Pseudomonas aeruginosa]MCT0529984.1 hypothetical protein [Pseudomonas aeruginosa]